VTTCESAASEVTAATAHVDATSAASATASVGRGRERQRDGGQAYGERRRRCEGRFAESIKHFYLLREISSNHVLEPKKQSCGFNR
jgi:hypothetical protein